MYQKFHIFILSFVLFFSSFHSVAAQERILPPEPPEEQFYKATVDRIVQEKTNTIGEQTQYIQTLQVTLQDGQEKGEKVTIEHGNTVKVTDSQKLKPGDNIVVVKTILPDRVTYSILDHYRLDTILYILLGFCFLVILVAGKKGIGSLVGMIFSIFIILQFIVPQILQGKDPLVISVLGSIVIMVLTLYLAHGINKRTTIALGSTTLSLLFTGILAYVFVATANLTGVGSEDAYLLQFGQASINLRGLLLGGIIIGALGVLDDITTSQTAAVFEIHDANKKLEFMDLVIRGYTVGKAHIASLVNTLVLAYAGASLSLFIMFVLNPSNHPVWVILNSQLIIEEVIRTIAGSIGLVLAVPITTILAAWAATRISSR